MVLRIIIFLTVIPLWTSTPRCAPQQIVQVIYLSKDEAARAKQISYDLKNATDKVEQANTAWQSFCKTFRLAHPELTDLSFATDLRIAFALRLRADMTYDVAAVELSQEERHKAESLRQDVSEATRVLDQVKSIWSAYQNELVANHFPGYTGSGSVVTLPSGKIATLPSPWYGGIFFTPDFSVAVPRYPPDPTR